MYSPSQLKEITPKPVDIPVGPIYVDTQVINQTLSKEDLERLRSDNLDNNISDDQKITL